MGLVLCGWSFPHPFRGKNNDGGPTCLLLHVSVPKQHTGSPNLSTVGSHFYCCFGLFQINIPTFLSCAPQPGTCCVTVNLSSSSGPSGWMVELSEISDTLGSSGRRKGSHVSSWALWMSREVMRNLAGLLGFFGWKEESLKFTEAHKGPLDDERGHHRLSGSSGWREGSLGILQVHSSPLFEGRDPCRPTLVLWIKKGD